MPSVILVADLKTGFVLYILRSTHPVLNTLYNKFDLSTQKQGHMIKNYIMLIAKQKTKDLNSNDLCKESINLQHWEWSTHSMGVQRVEDD